MASFRFLIHLAFKSSKIGISVSEGVWGCRPLSIIRSLVQLFSFVWVSFDALRSENGYPTTFISSQKSRLCESVFDALRSDKGYPATFISSQKSRLCESVLDALRSEKGYPATFISAQKSGLCEFVLMLSGAKRGTRPLSFQLRSPDFANSF